MKIETDRTYAGPEGELRVVLSSTTKQVRFLRPISLSEGECSPSEFKAWCEKGAAYLKTDAGKRSAFAQKGA